jgi:hypothetical protein
MNYHRKHPSQQLEEQRARPHGGVKSSQFPSTGQRLPALSKRASRSLDLGSGTIITAAQIVAIARKVASLTELRLARLVMLDDIRLFPETAPDLERVGITSLDKRDDASV